MIPDPFVVVPVQPLVTSIASLKLFVIHVAGKRHSGNHEVVVAQHFADSLDYVSIKTANRGADGNDRCDADNDADQSQKCAEFVGKDRLQGNL